MLFLLVYAISAVASIGLYFIVIKWGGYMLDGKDFLIVFVPVLNSFFVLLVVVLLLARLLSKLLGMIKL